MRFKYRVITSSTHASTLEKASDPSVRLLNVANDRIVLAQNDESPEVIDEDNDSAYSVGFTISSHSVSSASVRNGPDPEEGELQEHLQAELEPAGAPENPDPARPVRRRHAPIRFIPGGNPRETSFDSEGYPKE
ncbi:hypothetical protein FOL47_002441 [Perkinsus chesapeaki]|uniref:Uncharacterized protein n=1 Tax=Perkinsus chesapeaki TaxID=330153 RepID=A0A7J6KQ85_PERCH|nr:hypothetical protein FOL47_002441 [Perkinsus chesapeaki]